MKYKGFVLAVIHEGDCKSVKGLPEWQSFKTNKVAHVEILDPADGGKVYAREDSVKEAKAEIDRLLKILGMKDNTRETWSKLDGFEEMIRNGGLNFVDIDELDKENQGQ